MLDYSSGKLILAPMVRVGTLPVRLLCLQYGADIVYSEEIVDWKLLASVRRYNVTLDTVDYVDPADGLVVFRTCAAERNSVVLQMGTADPQRAVQVARKFERDVAGIDVNMGCPKEFSLKGGMGAALLQQPDKVVRILRALTANANVPVTCKIRVLSSVEDTLRFCRLVESCGVAALAVHGRRREDRPRHPNNDQLIALIANTINIPVIANGGSRHMSCRADIERFRSVCGSASVMVARAAMWNMSVFSVEGPRPLDEVITKLLQLCIRYDNPFTQVKYTVQQMLRELQETPRGKRFLQAQTVEDICVLWGLGDECRLARGPATVAEERPCSKRPRLEDGIVPGRHHFVRGHYSDVQLPKVLLQSMARSRPEHVAVYSIECCDKLFRAVCCYHGKRYASVWEKSKKFAEQGSALTCLLAMGMGGLPTDPEETRTTDPVPEETAPVSRTTDPVPEETAPMSRSKDPIPVETRTTHPVPEETAPVSRTTDLVPKKTRTTDPVPEETAPVSRTTDPVPKKTRTTDPVPEETAPVSRTTDPVPEETAPMSRSKDPIPVETRTTHPVPEETAPVSRTTDLVPKKTRTTDPAPEETAPMSRSKDPIPVETRTTHPVPEETAPVSRTTDLVPKKTRTTDPVPEETAPVSRTTDPVPKKTRTTDPVPEETAPVSRTTDPVPEETAPMSRSKDPIPVETRTTHPVPEETAPVSRTTDPVPKKTRTTDPVPEETAPVSRTTDPVPEETAPVSRTVVQGCERMDPMVNCDPIDSETPPWERSSCDSVLS